MADVIRAAGGLIWRDNSGTKELAVIHRARYGDWTLPKGKLEPDDDRSDTALREVREESGCKVQLKSFAGEVRYAVGDTPKIVKFWNISLSGRCDFQQSDEVDQLAWLTVSEALQQLDLDGERNLISKTHGKQTAAQPGASRV